MRGIRGNLVASAAAWALALGLGATVRGGVIMLYTQDTWEGGSGQTGKPDDQFINWVTNQLGHSVVKKVPGGVVSAATMQADAIASNASLIVIGPRNASGNYTDKNVNTVVTFPILSLLPHAIRQDRFDWVNAAAGADNTAWTAYTWLQPTDPRVSGIGTTLFSYPTGSGDTRWSTAGYNATTFAVTNGGQGTAIGARAATTNAEFMEWHTGDLLDSGQAAANRRVFFGGTNWSKYTGSYQCTFNANYTADGKHVLARIINDLIAGYVTTVVADPGGPYTVMPGGGTLLDGTGSFTTGFGSITSYAWDLNDDGLIELMGPGPQQLITYAYLTETLKLSMGQHQFKLTVLTNDYETAWAYGTFDISIPEPATLSLLGLGALALLRRRRS